MSKMLQFLKSSFTKKQVSRAFVASCFFLIFGFTQAQTGSIFGTVKDANTKEALIGANVFIQSLKKGTAVDPSGNYSLNNLPDGAYNLEISLLGYTKKDVQVNILNGAKTNMNFTLSTNSKLVDEVVVIGYGTVKKEDLTGSVSVVESKDFNKGVISSPDQLIQGKAAGVVITPTGGAPGSGGTIRIRGGASLNASNDPLIVIDGVPLEASFKADGTSNISGSPNPLSMINANDIETYTVLKDASAAAIYGNRASNGVIIITTKKGKTGKLKVSGNIIQSLQYRQNQVDVLEALELRTIVKNKDTARYRKEYLGKENANTDWQDEIYRTAHSMEYNANIQGGIKNLPYRLSVGYLGQEGILKTGYVKRPSLTLNLSPSFLDNTLNFNINLKGSIADNRFANVDAIGNAIRFDPNKPVYSGNDKFFGGYYEWSDNAGNPSLLAPKNPVAQLMQKCDISNVKRSIGNFQVDYKLPFLKGLRANVNFGYDIAKSKGHNSTVPEAATQTTNKGESTFYQQFSRNTLFDGYLNYNRTFESIKSVIDLTAGTGYQDFYRAVPASIRNEGKGTTVLGAPDSTQNTLLSFYTRLNYTLFNQFLFTGTLRRDGSSRFAKDKRWGLFPSAAIAWKINNLINVKEITELKLRVGFGTTGNQDIGRNYGYLANYVGGTQEVQYLFGNTPIRTFRPDAYNADLRWEKTTTRNLALDFGLFKNRITGSFEVYDKKTKDLINEVPLPAGANLSNRILANVGSVESKGVELTLNMIPVSTKDFTWQFGINGAYNTNKVTKITLIDDPKFKGISVGGIEGGTGNLIQIVNIGSPINSFNVAEQAYSPNGNPKNSNVNPVTGAVDTTLTAEGYIKKTGVRIFNAPNPLITLGMNTRITYRMWDLSTSLHGSIGNYLYNNVNANNGSLQSIQGTGYTNNVSRDYLNTNFTTPHFYSDYYLENASFLRMDHLTLTYDFGTKLKRVGMRISAIAQNVFVLTKYSGLDPEVFTGIDKNIYPKTKTYSIALNFEF
jgi:TonB-dependent starch-binding outer membrane protein SusC